MDDIKELELKCIKENCRYYFSSDNYFETCQLISKKVLLNKCHGLSEVPNKKEKIACKIAKLTEEFDYLCLLENLIKENQKEE
jgi:hypothetical protein